MNASSTDIAGRKTSRPKFVGSLLTGAVLIATVALGIGTLGADLFSTSDADAVADEQVSSDPFNFDAPLATLMKWKLQGKAAELSRESGGEEKVTVLEDWQYTRRFRRHRRRVVTPPPPPPPSPYF